GMGALAVGAAGAGIEPAKLGQAQARGVKQLENRLVAHRSEVVIGLEIDQRNRLVWRKRLGQSARRARRSHARHRIGADSLLAAQPVEEAPPGRKPAGDRARREATEGGAGHPAADIVLAYRFGSTLIGELAEDREFGAIGADGAR